MGPNRPMLPEYLKYWGLARPPFSLTPDPEMLYMSGQHQEGLLRLKYAVVSNKGGAMLVSENAGDGKTSLLAKLRRELHRYYQGRCNVVFIDHPTLTANQMVGEIARQLGLHSGTTDKLALLNDLRAYLLDCYRQGAKCVVILDEGQMLCHRPDILQELRILLNFCVSDAFLLTFILSGQKPLDEAIRAMPEFYQRLPVRFFLRNLGRDDTRELIRFRLRRAGLAEERELFSEDGYTGVYNFSKGCPRVICSVADLALVIAHSRWSKQVDFVSVSQACSDMNRTEGGYHYHYFLKAFNEGDTADSGNAMPGNEFLCPNCGAPLSTEDSDCPHCGHTGNAAKRPESFTAPEPVKEQEPETGMTAAVSASAVVPETTAPEPAALAPPVSKPNETVPPVETEPAPPVKYVIVPEPAIERSPETQSPGGMRFEIVEPDAEPEAEIERESDAPEPISDPLRSAGVTHAPDAVKCSFCGLVLELGVDTCPNCGENLGGEKRENNHSTALTGGDRKDVSGVEQSPDTETEKPDLSAEAALVKCRGCGAEIFPSGAAAGCPKCGRPFGQGPAELDLVSGLDESGLGRLIVSRRYVDEGAWPDSPVEEIVRLAPGRFWSRSAVAQYFNGNGRARLVARCGFSIRGSGLTLLLRGDTERIDYADIRRAGAEPVTDRGISFLYRLSIETKSGRWLVTLPYKGERGRSLATLLAGYLTARAAAPESPAAAGR